MSVVKMEYITVLKNPETHIDVGNYIGTEANERTYLRRLCSRFINRNMVIGVLMVFTLTSFLSQLPLHVQVKHLSEQLKAHGENIRDIRLEKEILLQRFHEIYKMAQDGQKRNRKERTASVYTPHFYLSGSERQSGVTDHDGIFMWKRPLHRSFRRDNDFFEAETSSADNSITAITILRTGVYFLFAKVTANGRNDFQGNIVPAVGICLKKNSEILETAWTTQDQRGMSYRLNRVYPSEEINYPMDSLSVFGLHRLQANDQIYIQRVPDRLNSRQDRFLSDDTKARFGAFLIEPCVNC